MIGRDMYIYMYIYICFLFARFRSSERVVHGDMQAEFSARTGPPRQDAIGKEQTFNELCVTMSQSNRMVRTIASEQQNRLQRAHNLNDWGLGMVPSFARCLGFRVAIGFTCIHLSDFCISPHFVS